MEVEPKSVRPLVSVIIPTYNRAELLGRCVGSVLGQSYGDFEIIIVDDASTDNTRSVIESFDDPRISYVLSETNRGVAVARNKGISMARGAYVAFLDSDDEWLPEKLESQMDCLKNSDNNVRVIYCKHYNSICSSGRLELSTDRLFAGDVYKQMLAGWCPSTSSLFLVERHLLSSVGLFDTAIPGGFEDYDLWLRLASKCHFGAVAKPLVVKHSHSISQLSRDPINRKEGLGVFLNKWSPVMVREVGNGPVDEWRRNHLSAIYADLVLSNVEQRNRLKSAREFLKYLRSTKKADYKRAIKLSIGVVGGLFAYNFAQAWWERLKQIRSAQHKPREITIDH